MRALEALKVRCVLLTSGTLAPLDSFAQELQLEFPISVENPHVIAESQAGSCLPIAIDNFLLAFKRLNVKTMM